MASSSKTQAATPGGSPMGEEIPVTIEAPPMVASEEEDSEIKVIPTPLLPIQALLKGFWLAQHSILGMKVGVCFHLS